jgi:hypothetical protein
VSQTKNLGILEPAKALVSEQLDTPKLLFENI